MSLRQPIPYDDWQEPVTRLAITSEDFDVVLLVSEITRKVEEISNSTPPGRFRWPTHTRNDMDEHDIAHDSMGKTCYLLWLEEKYSDRADALVCGTPQKRDWTGGGTKCTVVPKIGSDVWNALLKELGLPQIEALMGDEWKPVWNAITHCVKKMWEQAQEQELATFV